MTEMVHRELGKYTGEPVFPKWWHTVDRWTLISVVLLFGIGVLLNFAASPPLADRAIAFDLRSGQAVENAT